jgi:hypothetical protein
MSDSIHTLLQGAEEFFGEVLNDVEPYVRPEHVVHMLFFRRFTEWQYEYCRTIRTLHDANCLQGSIPVLRSLFEVSAAQLLLQRDERFAELLELLNGEYVKTGNALRKIDWPCSQHDIYARLSLMTHPSRISAFLGRTLDFESEPLKSLVEQEDIAGIAHVLLWQGARENEEAHQERWAFIALNTFDLTISSLRTLYGASAPERDWWKSQSILLFKDLADRYPTIKQDLLWFRMSWPHSEHSKLERSLDDLFSKELHPLRPRQPDLQPSLYATSSASPASSARSAQHGCHGVALRNALCCKSNRKV